MKKYKIDIREAVLIVGCSYLFALMICSIIALICASIWPATGPTVVIEIIGG